MYSVTHRVKSLTHVQCDLNQSVIHQFTQSVSYSLTQTLILIANQPSLSYAHSVAHSLTQPLSAVHSVTKQTHSHSRCKPTCTVTQNPLNHSTSNSHNHSQSEQLHRITNIIAHKQSGLTHSLPYLPTHSLTSRTNSPTYPFPSLITCSLTHSLIHSRPDLLSHKQNLPKR